MALTIKDAACGHGALAAALSAFGEKPRIEEVMKYFDKGGWINVPMMKAAIERAGKKWRRVEKPDPLDNAVILIQWLGPWTDPGRPPQAACQYRHWVASACGLIWDINTGIWQQQAEWKKIVPELLPVASTGYKVWGALVIE